MYRCTLRSNARSCLTLEFSRVAVAVAVAVVLLLLFLLLHETNTSKRVSFFLAARKLYLLSHFVAWDNLRVLPNLVGDDNFIQSTSSYPACWFHKLPTWLIRIRVLHSVLCFLPVFCWNFRAFWRLHVPANSEEPGVWKNIHNILNADSRAPFEHSFYYMFVGRWFWMCFSGKHWLRMQAFAIFFESLASAWTFD